MRYSLVFLAVWMMAAAALTAAEALSPAEALQVMRDQDRDQAAAPDVRDLDEARSRIAELEAENARLRARVHALERRLGLTGPPPAAGPDLLPEPLRTLGEQDRRRRLDALERRIDGLMAKVQPGRVDRALQLELRTLRQAVQELEDAVGRHPPTIGLHVGSQGRFWSEPHVTPLDSGYGPLTGQVRRVVDDQTCLIMVNAREYVLSGLPTANYRDGVRIRLDGLWQVADNYRDPMVTGLRTLPRVVRLTLPSPGE